jgi:hypothetical protein
MFSQLSTSSRIFTNNIECADRADTNPAVLSSQWNVRSESTVQRFENATTTTASSSDWPGIPKEEVGQALVQKGTNFVSDSRTLFLTYLDEFLDIYEKRPDKINLCGIRINHAYALFIAIKFLQPTSIIESGVNAGQSTYIMRAAAASPDTKIYAIDPLEQPICGQKERWIDTINAEYFTGKNFQDFGAIDWQKKINDGEIDPNKTLVFLDDHLKVYDRFPTFMKFGFRHVLLEDNYKANEGATNYDKAGWTPKQMFARIDNDSKFLFQILESYAEFPPLVPPITAKEWKGIRKPAGGFMAPNDTNTDIVEPILRPDIHKNDHELYLKIAKRLGIDPSLRDNESYMQMMNYNQFAYFEVASSPYLLKFSAQA